MNRTQLSVRVACPGDTDSVRRFLAGLSLATKYKRFMSPFAEVPPGLLRHLVSVAPRRVVLLAWDGDTVVGHAMAACRGEETVDLGIVVADRYQQTGIGHQLMGELIGIVTRAGVRRVHSDVLSENQLVLDWLRRLVPDIRLHSSGPTTEAYGYLEATA